MNMTKKKKNVRKPAPQRNSIVRPKNINTVQQHNDARPNGPAIAKRTTISATQFSGPLPPPEIFEKYNAVVPNAAERILCMAENQSNHRQKLEMIVAKCGARDSLLGVVFAFLICIAAIFTGGYVVLQGKSVAGSIISCSGLGGVITTFIYGTRSKREEMAVQRTKNMD
jgi:uncharacterized membrane protein